MSDQSHGAWMVTPVGASPVTRRIVLGIVFVLTLLVLIAPLALIFSSALSQGIAVFFRNLAEPGT